MSQILSLGLWILLSFAAGGALKCYNCLREHKNGTCLTGAPPCNARTGESCFRQQLFVENTVLYTGSGCVGNCKNVSTGVVIRHVNRCCSDEDLCNAP